MFVPSVHDHRDKCNLETQKVMFVQFCCVNLHQSYTKPVTLHYSGKLGIASLSGLEKFGRKPIPNQLSE